MLPTGEIQLPTFARHGKLADVPGASTEIGLGAMRGSRADMQCVGLSRFRVSETQQLTHAVSSPLLLLSRYVEHGGNANELGGGRLAACTDSLEDNTNASSIQSSSLGSRAGMENVVSDLAWKRLSKSPRRHRGHLARDDSRTYPQARATPE